MYHEVLSLRQIGRHNSMVFDREECTMYGSAVGAEQLYRIAVMLTPDVAESRQSCSGKWLSRFLSHLHPTCLPPNNLSENRGETGRKLWEVLEGATSGEDYDTDTHSGTFTLSCISIQLMWCRRNLLTP